MSETHRQLRDVFQRTERLSRDELNAYQIAHLEDLCRHARAQVPYYRERLDCVFDARDRFRFENWSKIPVLKRKALISERTNLIAGSYPEHHGGKQTKTSSGSTGVPVAVDISELAIAASDTLMERYSRWHRKGPATKVSAVIAGRKPGVADPPLGKRLDYSNGYASAMDIKTDAWMLTNSCSMQEQADWLARVEPEHVTLFAANARLLAEHYLRTGTRPPATLRSMMLTAENTTSLVRSLVEKAFGFSPTDCYGTLETGNLAFQRPDAISFYSNDECFLVEIVDGDLQELDAGESGNLLVTPLLNYAMPLIRYEIGDHGVRGARAGCDLPFGHIAEISGRVRDLFRRRNGEIVRARIAVETLHEAIGMSDFQLAQVGYEQVELRYVPGEKGVLTGDQTQLAEFVAETLGGGFEVRFIAVDDIPALPNGKRRDIACLLETEPEP